jgi:hypothetical protein
MYKREFIDTLIEEYESEEEIIKLPRKGHQVNFTHKRQSIPDTFMLNNEFYVGRIEEARLTYAQKKEIHLKYTFEEFVKLKYYNPQKPVSAIKQELIDLAQEHLNTRELVKFMCLINKL